MNSRVEKIRNGQIIKIKILTGINIMIGNKDNLVGRVGTLEIKEVGIFKKNSFISLKKHLIRIWGMVILNKNIKSLSLILMNYSKMILVFNTHKNNMGKNNMVMQIEMMLINSNGKSKSKKLKVEPK